MYSPQTQYLSGCSDITRRRDRSSARICHTEHHAVAHALGLACSWSVVLVHYTSFTVDRLSVDMLSVTVRGASRVAVSPLIECTVARLFWSTSLHRVPMKTGGHSVTVLSTNRLEIMKYSLMHLPARMPPLGRLPQSASEGAACLQPGLRTQDSHLASGTNHLRLVNPLCSPNLAVRAISVCMCATLILSRGR